jgi:hypothetical protein
MLQHSQGVIATVSAFTFVVNVPFGYWRAGTRKFSAAWFLAIHLPVPLIVAARLILHPPNAYIPLFVLCFFLGQLAGGLVRKRRTP